MTLYPRVSTLKSADDFRRHQASLGIEIPLDERLEEGPQAPLARPLAVGPWIIGNRFCVLPMEGWDGTADGCPSELTLRRWRNFGLSGGKLIWGGEAVAVRADGRANPNQLWIRQQNLGDFVRLRETLLDAHRQRHGRVDDLLVGLQLTHSGRFAKPNDKRRLEPRILYHHPILDRKFGLGPDYPLMNDGEIRQLVDDFVLAAERAATAGFDFVDLKHCHGYLGHEFLSAFSRPGPYGGSFENRTRFLRELVEGVRARCPKLGIGVRLSAMDWIPFHPGAEQRGEPEPYDFASTGGRYPWAFGGDGTGVGHDLAEAREFLRLLGGLDVRLVCITVGSPYYNPHIQRPALFPPSDGYQPPEDPLVGVARQIAVTAELKRGAPEMVLVGSGYSYLQEWLPNVGQAVVRQGLADFVGLGRMILSYPEMAADVLAGRPLERKRICRTFSDCTTGPRNGLVSGCYPLDPFYKQLPEAQVLAEAKKRVGQR